MSEEPNKLAEEVLAEPAAPATAEDQPAPPADVPETAGVETEAIVGEESIATDEAEDTASAEEESTEETDENTVEEETEEETEEDAPLAEESSAGDEDESVAMDWYILKVQSNRERSISDALRRKIAIEGLDEFFGEVVVPTEKVTEFKGGKKKVVERKLYPGYIVVHMHINDDTWFAVRETSGIGDFTGSGGKPTPMLAHEVARIIQTEEEETTESPKLNINFNLEDKVKIKEGTFESFEGEVNAIDTQSGRITVMINIFGRSTPVELEYWQVEQV